MNIERDATRVRSAGFAALGDPGRLQVVDRLLLSDAQPAELAGDLGMTSSLLAHHLKVLEDAGLIRRLRSEGDRRRTYVQLIRAALPTLDSSAAPLLQVDRVLFVCTANSARSQLAASLWRTASDVPAASAGTHPAPAVAAGALAAARRHGLSMARATPRVIEQVHTDGDLIVTVCDRAREELGTLSAIHWSIPDPVSRGTDAAFEEALTDLGLRVHGLATRLTDAS